MASIGTAKILIEADVSRVQASLNKLTKLQFPPLGGQLSKALAAGFDPASQLRPAMNAIKAAVRDTQVKLPAPDTSLVTAAGKRAGDALKYAITAAAQPITISTSGLSAVISTAGDAGSRAGRALSSALTSAANPITVSTTSLEGVISSASVTGNRAGQGFKSSMIAAATPLTIPDTSIDSTVSRLKAAGDEAGAGFSANFSKGAKAGLGAAASLIAAIGLGSLVKEAGEASDATIKFGSTLKFAGLANSDIQRLTASTKTYADTTVYSIADIQNITAQLAANGVPNYDRLAEAAGNLNSIAGGTADTYKAVGMVLTQTAGRGKLVTENWNQLSNAIPGAAGKVKEALEQAGAFTGNFNKAMELGEITAEEFNVALLKLGTEPVAVEAAKSTKTFEGALGGLKAAAISLISGALDKMRPALMPIINGLAQGVAAAAEFISKMDFMPIITTVMSGLDFAMTAVSNTITIVANAAKFLGDNWTWLGPLVIAVGTFAVGIAAISKAILVWNAITGIATLVQAGFNLVLNANPISIIILAIAALVTGLVYFFTQTEVGKQAWASFTQFISDAWKNVSDFLGTSFTWLHDNVFAPFFDGLGNFLAFLGDVWNGIVGVIHNVSDVIQGIIDGIVSAFRSLVSFFSDAIDNIVNFFQGMGNSIGGAIDGIIGFFQDLGSTVGDIVGNILSFFGDLSNGVQDAVNSVSSFVSDFINIGSEMVNGLIDGIIGAAQGVMNAIGDVVGGAINWAKSLLGINSPSRVFRAFGSGTGSGFVLGIYDMFSKVKSTVQTVFGNLANKIDPGKTKFASMGKTAAASLADGLQSERSTVQAAMKSLTDGTIGQLTVPLSTSTTRRFVDAPPPVKLVPPSPGTTFTPASGGGNGKNSSTAGGSSSVNIAEGAIVVNNPADGFSVARDLLNEIAYRATRGSGLVAT